MLAVLGILFGLPCLGRNIADTTQTIRSYKRRARALDEKIEELERLAA